MSIQRRLLLALSVSGLVFVMAFGFFFVYKSQGKKLLQEGARHQFSSEVEGLVTLLSAPLHQVTYDYTYWDEFVTILRNPDTAWFEQNIGTIIESFDFDFVAVMDTSGAILFEAAKEGNLIPAIDKSVVSQLKRDRFAKFFQVAGEEVCEISSATVHGTSDPTHMLTRPSGILLIGRYFHAGYLSRLSALSNAEVRLAEQPGEIKTDKAHTITTWKTLAGIDGKPLMHIAFTRCYDTLRVYSEVSKTTLIVMLVSMFTILLIISTIIQSEVNRPLDLISNILRTESNESIRLLMKSRGEFGRIGELFESYVVQKRQLDEARERAVRSDKTKSEFLANMSHEIRTPMNGIVGFSELLSNPDLPLEKRKKFAGILISNSEQLLRIIDDILEISNLETGRVRVNLTEVGIPAILEELQAVFSIRAAKKKIKIEIDSKGIENDGHYWTDKSKLLKILGNLTENAMKFTESGTISISCHLRNHQLVFHVKDTGIGIPLSEREKIFDRFEQANSKISGKYGGLGLGLAIVRENVELLNGTLGVDSRPGEGSDFWFTIPAKPVTGIVAENESETRRPDRRNRTILVAEDDPSSYIYLEALLAELYPNFSVLHATNGHEAVRICRESDDIDLVLMDLKMPEKDGFEATREILSFRPELKVVAQSAFVTNTAMARASSAGCVDFISKPVNAEALHAAIAHILSA